MGGSRSEEVEVSEVGAFVGGSEGEEQGEGKGEMEVEGGDTPAQGRRPGEEFFEEAFQFLKVWVEAKGRPGHGRYDAGEAAADEREMSSLPASEGGHRPGDLVQELVREGEESSCEGERSALGVLGEKRSSALHLKSGPGQKLFPASSIRTQASLRGKGRISDEDRSGVVGLGVERDVHGATE